MTRAEIRKQVSAAIYVCLLHAMASDWDRATFDEAAKGMILEFLEMDVPNQFEQETWIDEWERELAQVPLHVLRS